MDEFSWAVGFFEGEGCISLTRYKNVHIADGYHRSMSVTSTDRENVERFQSAVGVGQLHAPSSRSGDPGRAHHKPTHRWSLTRWAEIESLLNRMLPHLSSRRQEAARKMLDNPATHARTNGRDAFCRVVCSRGHRLTAATVYVRPNGHRECRECAKAAARKRTVIEVKPR